MTPNSRSYLNRWTQPDSIIPDPTNPQSWNRYSYVTNSPLRYTDPSGHRNCLEDGYCIEDRYGNSSYLASFGITTSGLRYAENFEIGKAATLDGQKFAAILGTSAADAFRKTHGDITIEVGAGKGPVDRNGRPYGNCETSWNGSGSTISCHSALNVTNAVHEFGHAFDNYYRYHSPGDSDLLASNYDMITPRVFTGYMCDTSPCLEHSWKDFPADSVFVDPRKNYLEEFADMYLNWILDGSTSYPQNGFSPDEAGAARRSIMNRDMENVWLPNMSLLP